MPIKNKNENICVGAYQTAHWSSFVIKLSELSNSVKVKLT